MPYSGVHQTTMGKLESNHSKMINYSADLSFPPDNECMELLWENGQIVMQGQSSRTRKSGFPTNISSQSPKCKEKEFIETEDEDAVIPKINMDSFMNDFPASGPAGQVGLVQDDDMGPWLNYPIDDCLPNDYYSELFSELSGVNMTSPSVQNNQVPIHKNVSFSQGFRNTGNMNRGDGSLSNVVVGGSEPTKPRTSQLISTMQQTSFSNSTHTPISMAERPNAKMTPRATPPQTNNNTGFVNFSHFSRPAALVKANLQSIGASASDRLRSSRKVSVVGSSPVESSLIKSNNESKAVSGIQGKSVGAPMKVDLHSSTKPSKEPISAEQSEAIFHEDAFRNNKPSDHVLSQSSSFAASAVVGGAENEKNVERVVASSSVCSGNSVGGVSNNPKHGAKRKSRDVEESEYQSEDIEDESVDVKKSTTGRSSSAKRTRAAEVHNLSERRRRDRINEKMRALQELIPNCNKVDKASMLDEAIEYLKTLQLQVQIMSMGSGLCMPPMMFPAGMQNMHAPHMAHFSPMGVGMGMAMGMGFGMGMLDPSCSSGRPLIPVPPMRGAQFPYLPGSGPMSLHGMPGSNLQMFGIPGPGLPMSMPRAPFNPLSGFSTGVISVSDVSGAACPAPVPDSAPCSSSRDQIQNTNVHTMHKATADCSRLQICTQTTKESIQQSALVRNDNQTSQHESLCRYGMESSGRTT